jgi:hypothetical protein
MSGDDDVCVFHGLSSGLVAVASATRFGFT